MIVFFAVLIAGSAYFEDKILVLGGSIQNHLGVIWGLVWWVTVSAVVARLVLRESPRDVSFRWGGSRGTRAMAIATAMPLVVGFIAYGIAWSVGLANFRAPELSGAVLGMHFTLAGNPLGRFSQCLGVMLVFGALGACKYTAGEEIGWRGYMLTRLVDSGFRAPILISGLVWGLWHAPLIISGQYAAGAHPIWSACLFLAGIVAGGYVFAWLRLSSGSIWPCIWGHSVWNSVIQGAFDRSTSGRNLWGVNRVHSRPPSSFCLQLCSTEYGRWHGLLNRLKLHALPANSRFSRMKVPSQTLAKSDRSVPPVWLMGLSNTTLGLVTGFSFFVMPQLLAAERVSEAKIAAITAVAIPRRDGVAQRIVLLEGRRHSAWASVAPEWRLAVL